MRNHQHLRRTLQKQGDITAEWLETLREQASVCPLCAVNLTDFDASLGSHKNLDHIIPVGVGGTHTMDNVRYICRTCNTKRPKDGSDT